jgi:TPR repeat protein
MKYGSLGAVNNHAVCLALGIYGVTPHNNAGHRLSMALFAASQPAAAFEVLCDLVKRTVPRPLLREWLGKETETAAEAGVWPAAVNEQHRLAAPIALVNVGSCYHAAIGVAQDYGAAALLYRMAIALPTALSSPTPPTAFPPPLSVLSSPPPSNGHVRAHSLLGLMYSHGFGPVPHSELFCEAHCRSTALRGYVYSQRELGVLYARKPTEKNTIDGAASGGARYNPKLSFEWYLKAAMQGFTLAQIRVGEM